MSDFDEDIPFVLRDELLAAVALLGKRTGDGGYIKGDECIDSLKDLQQFLQRDDPVGDIEETVDDGDRKHPWELHRSLGDWNVLQQHLLPLLANHGEDPEILYESMVVLYLMTQLPPPPTIHLDDDRDTVANKRRTYGAAITPSFENLVEIKLQFARSDRALAVVMHWLIEPLQHVGADRSEAENILLDLALNLIHNLLQRRPPIEHDVLLQADLRNRLLSANDELVLKFAEENVLEMLVLLAQNIEDDENRNWNLLLLDIFTLIFAHEVPEEIISAQQVQRIELSSMQGLTRHPQGAAWKESERRKELIKLLPPANTGTLRRQRLGCRHQRFAGAIVTETSSGIRIVSRNVVAEPKLPDRPTRGGRRKRPLQPEQNALGNGGMGRSRLLQELDKFAALFIEVGFNSLIGTVTYDYEMESAAIMRNDDFNFMELSSWCMRYHRCREKSRIAQLPPRPKEATSSSLQDASGGVSSSAHAATPPVAGDSSAPRMLQTSATVEYSRVEEASNPHAALEQKESWGESKESKADRFPCTEEAPDSALPNSAAAARSDTAEHGQQETDTANAEGDSTVIREEPVLVEDLRGEEAITELTNEAALLVEVSGNEGAGDRSAEQDAHATEQDPDTCGQSATADSTTDHFLGNFDSDEAKELKNIEDRSLTQGQHETIPPMIDPAKEMKSVGFPEVMIENETFSVGQNMVEQDVGTSAETEGPPKLEIVGKEMTERDVPSADTSSEVQEKADLYDYNAAFVSSIVDLKSIKWALDKALKAAKPEKGSGVRPHWDQLPRVVGMLREMMLVLQALYHSRTPANRGVATTILRNMIYDFEFAEVLLMLLKEYRPFRNGVAYLADLVEVTHTVMRLIKSFSEEAGGGLQRLRKRRRRRGRRRIEGEEGDGDWLDEGNDELEEEDVDEVVFTFDALLLKFATPQVVSAYVYLLSHYCTNAASANHQALKMLDTIARKCEMLPLLFQLSVLRVFDRILSDASLSGQPQHLEMVRFIQWVLREFFQRAAQAPCLFLEPLVWTRTHRDASAIMRAYQPEERTSKKRAASSAAAAEGAILRDLANRAGKWSADDDLALREAFLQFQGRRNVTQIIAALFEGKTSKQGSQVASRLRALELDDGHYASDSDADAAASADMHAAARNLRRRRAPALTWIIDRLSAARAALARIRAGAEAGGLRAEHMEAEDFAVVPTDAAEWEYVVDGEVMRLMAAMGFKAPRAAEGSAFWHVPASIFKPDTADSFNSLIADLESIAVTPWAENEEEEQVGTEEGGTKEESSNGVGERTPEAAATAIGSAAAERSGEQTRRKKRLRLRRSGGDSGSDDAGTRAYSFTKMEEEEAASPNATSLMAEEHEQGLAKAKVGAHALRRARRMFESDDDAAEHAVDQFKGADEAGKQPPQTSQAPDSDSDGPGGVRPGQQAALSRGAKRLRARLLALDSEDDAE